MKKICCLLALFFLAAPFCLAQNWLKAGKGAAQGAAASSANISRKLLTETAVSVPSVAAAASHIKTPAFSQPEIRNITAPVETRTVTAAPIRPFLQDATLVEMPDIITGDKKHKLVSLSASIQKIFSIRKRYAEKQRMAEFDNNADESVFSIQDKDGMYGGTPFSASAFVIEEEYGGEKFLWGVTSAHILNIMGQEFYVHLPGFPFPWKTKVVFMGDPGMADVAIFPIPQEYSDWLKPIPLATKEPEIGEALRSFGYFNGGFNVVRNRIVKEVTKGRIITSLEFNTKERGGACGGPLLNSYNELVGIHCGTSDSRQVSFVVPVWQLKDLLTAYRNNGISMQKLKFKNHEIGEININQYISTIRVFSDNVQIDEFNTFHQAKKIDYDRLEDLVFAEGADRIELQFGGQYNPNNPTELKQFTYTLVYLPLEERSFIEYTPLP